MNKNYFAVIMAGGYGERFWPESRQQSPKHLLPIVGESSMLAQTVSRLEGMVPQENILVVTNIEQREAILAQCPSLQPSQVVGEPARRDTAAAVGLAKVLVKQRNPNGVFVMLPSDHVIKNKDGFQSVLTSALALAQAGEYLVTVGIEPLVPATAYGYLQRGEALDEAVPGYEVARFVEKPSLPQAQDYLKEGTYYWNAGMFAWSVKTLEAAYRQYVPNLADALEGIEIDLKAGDGSETHLAEVLAVHYPGIEKISIDYALMEKAKNVVMVESEFDWDDVGSWPAVANHYAKDGAGNVIPRGQVLVGEDAKNNLIISPTNKAHITAVLGVEGLVIVSTEDATLVVPKNRAEEVKKLVQAMGASEAMKQFI